MSKRINDEINSFMMKLRVLSNEDEEKNNKDKEISSKLDEIKEILIELKKVVIG